MDVETLAQAVHESSREPAMFAGREHCEWAELPEGARRLRRVMARHLLERYTVAPRVRVTAPSIERTSTP